MYGVRGQEFEDRTVGTKTVDGRSLELSEYGGFRDRDPYVERAVGKEPARLEIINKGKGFIQRARDAINERLLAMGGPPAEEIEKATRLRLETTYSHRADHSIASDTAYDLYRKPDAEIARNLPALDGVALPKHPELHWVAVASAAVDIVHRHVDQGPDEGFEGEFARRMRLQTVKETPSYASGGSPTSDPSKGLQEALRQRSNEMRDFLSSGPQVDEATTRQAMSLADRHLHRTDLERRFEHVTPYVEGPMPDDKFKRYEWVRDALVTERAMARGGLLSDEQVLDASKEFAREGGRPYPVDKQTFQAPASDARQLPPAERMQIVQREKEAIAPQAPSAAPTRDKEDTGIAPSRAAALGALHAGMGR